MTFLHALDDAAWRGELVARLVGEPYLVDHYVKIARAFRPEILAAEIEAYFTEPGESVHQARADVLDGLLRDGLSSPSTAETGATPSRATFPAFCPKRPVLR